MWFDFLKYCFCLRWCMIVDEFDNDKNNNIQQTNHKNPISNNIIIQTNDKKPISDTDIENLDKTLAEEFEEINFTKKVD